MSGKCRNCGSDEKYTREVFAVDGDGLNLLPIKGLLGSFNVFDLPKYRLEVCGHCGLTEWYVPEHFLPELKEKFEKISAGQ